MFIDFLAGALPSIFPDVTNSEDLNVFASGIAAGDVGPGATQQMSAPLAAHADEAHANAFIG